MVESTSKAKVVITGISGYLGSYVCHTFLQDGRFQIRGTVRDPNNEAKVEPLRKAFGDKFSELELFKADLLNPESIDKAIEGCDYVVHTASPVPSKGLPKDENVLIRPAVEGTLAVLKAALKHKVKRVVVTSSLSAIVMKNDLNVKEVYDENDWSDLEACSAYDKSKTMAERAAWEFLYSIPEADRFELVCINPVFILGPALVPPESSTLAVKHLMEGKFPFLPKVMLVLVDIRECAMAHLKALTIPEARNKRFILGSQNFWIKEVGQILKEEFPMYKIPSKEISYCPIKFASFFSSQVKTLIPMWRRHLAVNNQLSKDILGIEYRDYRETLRATAESLIEFGLIPDKRNNNNS